MRPVFLLKVSTMALATPYWIELNELNCPQLIVELQLRPSIELVPAEQSLVMILS